jgi:hypothetical protein
MKRRNVRIKPFSCLYGVAQGHGEHYENGFFTVIMAKAGIHSLFSLCEVINTGHARKGVICEPETFLRGFI